MSELKVNTIVANTDTKVTVDDALVVNETLEVAGVVTLSGLNAAGFVKNDANGVISTSDVILESDLPNRIDATKFANTEDTADHTVTNEMFQYLGPGPIGTPIEDQTPVRSSIQAQINDITTPATSGSPVTIGTISTWAGVGVTAPEGWLLCDGQKYAIAGDYAELYDVIGYTFTVPPLIGFFAVPDLRGMFVRGWLNTASKGNPRDPGGRTGFSDDGFAQGGVGIGSIQDSDNLKHTHLGVAGPPKLDYQWAPGNIGDPITSFNSLSATGQDGAAESRPPNISLMYIIKY